MFRSQKFENGLLSVADGIVTVKHYCISEDGLSVDQIAKLESSPNWVKVEEMKVLKAPVESSAFAEQSTPAPKRKRGRPRKSSTK